MNIAIKDLFDLKHTIARNFFKPDDNHWFIVRDLHEIIQKLLLTNLKLFGYTQISDQVWIGQNVSIEKTALIQGPAIIGHHTEIRHAAFIRQNVIIGDYCVIGNSSEIKNSVLFNKVQAPHFNYVGDSVLGFAAHLGAGVILSNFKSDGSLIKSCGIDSGLNKLGAALGDMSEIGCNSVLFPGSVIGRKAVIYPLMQIRGYVPENTIYKSEGNLVQRL